MLGGMFVFALSAARLAHASERNAVIARNVAHADTPGYRAQDVAAFDFGRMAADTAVQPTATRPGHAVGRSPLGRPELAVSDASATDESPNGNTVSLEEQMVLAAEARGDFELAAALYAKHLSLLRTAIGRDGR